MDGRELDISILLTTYAREDDCILCLNSLLPQLNSNVEVLLLNDLHIDSLNLRTYCKENNIKYVHTGIQKGGEAAWRVPGFALNIGAKLSKGKYLVLGNAEIYHVSNDTLEKMYILDALTFPRVYDQPRQVPLSGYKSFPILAKYPFLMGVPREVFFGINGYDEDFVGYAWEDADLCQRLNRVATKSIEVDADVIHLWNQRGQRARPYAPNLKYVKLDNINKNLYYQKIDIMVRNVDKDWGKF